jgi:hypothetical protein
MKTIEEFVFDKYLSQQSKAEKYKIDASNYIDWANIAVSEAQRFIPIEEELPPYHTKILVIDSISKQESFGQFSQNMEWFHCHKSTNVFAKSDITHWRPLFRK